ncbi:MAG TPA: SRPBCC family protein, partial [Acidimicrobiales bacterium]
MRTSTSAITINAPRDVVWVVVTLPEYVRQWQYNSELTTDWTVGHPIRFSAEWQGQAFEQWGTVLEFDEPSRLRYSLFAPRPGLDDIPENYFTMTYELTDVDDGTLVTFIQEDPR